MTRGQALRPRPTSGPDSRFTLAARSTRGSGRGEPLRLFFDAPEKLGNRNVNLAIASKRPWRDGLVPARRCNWCGFVRPFRERHLMHVTRASVDRQGPSPRPPRSIMATPSSPRGVRPGAGRWADGSCHRPIFFVRSHSDDYCWRHPSARIPSITDLHQSRSLSALRRIAASDRRRLISYRQVTGSCQRRPAVNGWDRHEL